MLSAAPAAAAVAVADDGDDMQPGQQGEGKVGSNALGGPSFFNSGERQQLVRYVIESGEDKINLEEAKHKFQAEARKKGTDRTEEQQKHKSRGKLGLVIGTVTTNSR